MANAGVKRIAVTAAAVPVGLALLLGAEVLIAINGPMLEPREPYALSGRVGEGDETPLRIVWIGDSISAGVGASDASAAVPHLVAAGLGRPVELHVFAVSGARVADALEMQVPRLEAVDAPLDVAVVEIGANDVTHLTGGGALRRDYEAVLDRVLHTSPRHVLALGIPAFGTTPRFLQPLRAIAGWRGRRLDEQIREAAAARGVRYVDIAAATGPAFAADPERYYSADDFHPSDAGYRLWADAVVKALDDLAAIG